MEKTHFTIRPLRRFDMGKLVEGRWDCSYCGTKGILGRNRECPNCGRQRGKDVKFYVANPKDYVPEEEAKNISRKPDWLCDHCGAYNPDESEVCKTCGAHRAGNKDYFDVQSEEEARESVNGEDKDKENCNNGNGYDNDYESYNDVKKSENYGLLLQDDVEEEKVGFLHRRSTLIAVGIVAVIMLVWGLALMLAPRKTTMEITGFSWSRSFDVEQMQTFHENDWYVPEGGTVTYQQMEIHHYDSVIDHYETETQEVEKERIAYYEYSTNLVDLGNGYFDEETVSTPVYETYYETETYEVPIYRDEPVYEMMYYYDIDRYTYVRTVRTEGIDKSPYWGDDDIAPDERIYDEYETYRISGLENDRNETALSAEINYDKWEQLEIGDTVRVKVYPGGRTEIMD